MEKTSKQEAGMKRVVVTGMGAITPIGNNVEEFWNNIKDGKVGIDNITKFDTTDFKVKLAAEVKNYNPEDIWTKKQREEWNYFANMQ